MLDMQVKTFCSKEAFICKNGQQIKELCLSYHTFGSLNAQKDNAILVCHFFSGSKHVAGCYEDSDVPGWWDDLIGPGKTVDTNKYFVICSDSLCCMSGSDTVHSSGPRSIDPETGKPYALNFPVITIEDMVHAQKRLADELGIEQFAYVMGPSMGALQSMQWSVSYPEMVKNVIAVTAAPQLHNYAKIFPLRTAINSVYLDKNFKNGEYYSSQERPIQGMENAVAGLTLMGRPKDWLDIEVKASDADCDTNIRGLSGFERVVGDIAKDRVGAYDANCFLYIAKANILFDLYEQGKHQVLSKITANYLLIAEKSDIFFTVDQIRAFHQDLLDHSINSLYFEFDSPAGHLGGVTRTDDFSAAIHQFLSHRQ